MKEFYAYHTVTEKLMSVGQHIIMRFIKECMKKRHCSENLLIAEKYWSNGPNKYGKVPIKEILVNGDIEVCYCS